MELNAVAQTVLVQSTATLDNSYVLESRNRYPSRLAVVCRVDVDDPHAADTLAGLHAAGAETLRLRNFHRSPGRDPLAIWRAAAELGMSVSVGGPAAGFADPQFARLVAELPNLTIVMEHLAGMGIHAIGAPEMPPLDTFRQALSLARCPNAYIKIHGMGEISDPPFPYRDTPPLVRMAYDAFGPERILWGFRLAPRRQPGGLPQRPAAYDVRNGTLVPAPAPGADLRRQRPPPLAVPLTIARARRIFAQH